MQGKDIVQLFLGLTFLMKNFIILKNKHISGIINGAGKYRATHFSSESQTSPHSVVSCFHFNLQNLHGINQAKIPTGFSLNNTTYFISLHTTEIKISLKKVILIAVLWDL